MASSVNPKVDAGGAKYIYYMFYIWGFTSAFTSYSLLSHFWPDANTLIPETIHGDEALYDADGDIVDAAEETGSEKGSGGVVSEKKAVTSQEYPI